MTAAELRRAGIGLHTRDSLSLSGFMYPRLVEIRDDADAQRYLLAAPDQQAELDAMLAVVAAHPDGISQQEIARDSDPARWWRDVVIDHMINAGLVGTSRNWSVLHPPVPGGPPPSAWWAERVARRGPAWRQAVTAA